MTISQEYIESEVAAEVKRIEVWNKATSSCEFERVA